MYPMIDFGAPCKIVHRATGQYEPCSERVNNFCKLACYFIVNQFGQRLIRVILDTVSWPCQVMSPDREDFFYHLFKFIKYVFCEIFSPLGSQEDELYPKEAF